MARQVAESTVEQALPPSTTRIEVIDRARGIKTYECGHRGADSFRLHLFGEEFVIKLQKARCPECFVEHAKAHVIHCATCGLSITPGQLVMLYPPHWPEIKREIATALEDGRVIGCSRWSCYETGFLAGRWTEDGYRSN